MMEVTARSRNDSKTATSPKPTPAQVTVPKDGKLEHSASLQGVQQDGEGPFQVTLV